MLSKLFSETRDQQLFPYDSASVVVSVRYLREETNIIVLQSLQTTIKLATRFSQQRHCAASAVPGCLSDTQISDGRHERRGAATLAAGKGTDTASALHRAQTGWLECVLLSS